jgi:hypothetical protein
MVVFAPLRRVSHREKASTDASMQKRPRGLTPPPGHKTDFAFTTSAYVGSFLVLLCVCVSEAHSWVPSRRAQGARRKEGPPFVFVCVLKKKNIANAVLCFIHRTSCGYIWCTQLVNSHAHGVVVADSAQLVSCCVLLRSVIAAAVGTRNPSRLHLLLSMSHVQWGLSDLGGAAADRGR